MPLDVIVELEATSSPVGQGRHTIGAIRISRDDTTGPNSAGAHAYVATFWDHNDESLGTVRFFHRRDSGAWTMVALALARAQNEGLI